MQKGFTIIIIIIIVIIIIPDSYNFPTMQVYFLWICPTHRNFEWFIDVLREVERKDVTNVLDMHIFITQVGLRK